MSLAPSCVTNSWARMTFLDIGVCLEGHYISLVPSCATKQLTLPFSHARASCRRPPAVVLMGNCCKKGWTRPLFNSC